ncbi:MAG: heavy-metal-associated domain-containing protein [Actinomycetota bacterium]|nr:heavy-metal-associated domain-containing protein [Actinomycetota bacterium]
MSTTTYEISGMTCGHCVNSVKEAIEVLDGVTDVEVDLARGRATVTSEALLDAGAVKAAVEEAGYQLAP